jgi:hypothetical protein
MDYEDKESTHVSDHDYNIEGSLSRPSETIIYILDITGKDPEEAI